ncbi:unnamed protein product [Orchesella dallaii]|uniref:Uncharacterized protein n=1 Tax=Orchesella dallaii TaxID=48710 RepID=A0ABP1RVP8_9HEXA
MKMCFHTYLRDENYDVVSRRFGTSRCVTSIWIEDYSMTDIPIHNLTFLKNLTVGEGNVHKLAISELLSKATNLTILRVFVDHGQENATINVAARSGNSYPALLSIKVLYVSYSCKQRSSSNSERAWNEILYEKMPNVHRLVVNLYTVMPPVKGFDYFRLASGMPKLRDFTCRIYSRPCGLYFKVPADVQPLNPTILLGLEKLNLTRLEASLIRKDEPVWEVILAKQRDIQELNLSNEFGSKESFSFSLIPPVIHNNKESLRSISLQIDTKKSGDFDMDIFASFPTLRELVIQAWPLPNHGETYSNPSDILNCSKALSEKIEKLSVIGFKLLEEDIINLIKKIPNEHVDFVRICPEYAAEWKSFENRMEEMGIVRHGHSCTEVFTNYLFLKESLSPSNVYIGEILEKFCNYGFEGFLKYDFSRRVKDVTVEHHSLEVVSRFMYSYK